MTTDDLMLIDGHNNAFLGTVMTWNGTVQQHRAVYSGEQIVENLIDSGMSGEEALEYVEYNIIGAYVGPATPAVLWEYDLDDLQDA